MQTADVLVALAGDRGNTVPKPGVTAAEIAVLIQIHGDDAVHEINPGPDKDVSPTEELERLRAKYGRAKDGEGRPLIDYVYPGNRPRLHESLADLDLPDEMFVATGRQTPSKSKARASKAKTSKPAKAPEPAKATDDEKTDASLLD